MKRILIALMIIGGVNMAQAMVGPSSSDDKEINDIFDKYHAQYNAFAKEYISFVKKTKQHVQKIEESYTPNSRDYKQSMDALALVLQSHTAKREKLVKEWEKESYDWNYLQSIGERSKIIVNQDGSWINTAFKPLLNPLVLDDENDKEYQEVMKPYLQKNQPKADPSEKREFTKKNNNGPGKTISKKRISKN